MRVKPYFWWLCIGFLKFLALLLEFRTEIPIHVSLKSFSLSLKSSVRIWFLCPNTQSLYLPLSLSNLISVLAPIVFIKKVVFIANCSFVYLLSFVKYIFPAESDFREFFFLHKAFFNNNMKKRTFLF